MAETLTVGGTYRFRLTATLDGAAWDLDNAAVTLRLTSPAGVTVSLAATVQSPTTAGIALYDCTTSDLVGAGLWSRSWLVVQAGTSLPSLPVFFAVV